MREDPGLSRHRLARELCEHFDWRDALGRPKEMACRKYLLQLQRRGTDPGGLRWVADRQMGVKRVLRPMLTD